VSQALRRVASVWCSGESASCVMTWRRARCLPVSRLASHRLAFRKTPPFWRRLERRPRHTVSGVEISRTDGRPRGHRDRSVNRDRRG
jgi:hypothetical protein